MKLSEAIEINKSLLDGTYDHRDEAMENALKLDIQALKRLKDIRKDRYPRDLYPLPGETEE